MIKENFKEAVKEFDFKKVKKVMKSLKWTWYGSSKSPSIKEMKSSLKELFKNALVSPNMGTSAIIISTGGFELTINEDDSVSIKFVVEESFGG
jgi:hypothetical protein